MPRFSLPEERWAADMCCALELPRAATWSPQEQLAAPWYTFCRPRGHDPFGWWSYGMHAHEHLATFAAVKNLAVRHACVSVEVRRSAETSATTFALNGRPLPFVAGRGARVEWGQLPANAQILAVVPGRPAGPGAQPAPGPAPGLP